MALAPRDEQDLAAVIAGAAQNRTPLAVGGAGTKAAIGRPAQAEASLSVTALSGITLYEPAELVISARAGTPVAEVRRVLGERGQDLAFEPADYRALLGSRGEPTIGAVAAANLAGPRRIMAGSARDSLIGVRFVNGRGEVVKSGGRVMKNVTGLDLVKLMAGSWGTLGVLTEVTFKVLPKPERSSTLIFRGLEDRQAIAALCAAVASPFEVSGAAHLPALDRLGARTLLRIEGFSVSVDYRIGEVRRLLKRCGSPDILEGRGAEALWQSVRDATLLSEPKDAAIWRISTAPTHGPDIVDAIAQSLDIRWYYDWSGGLIWVAASAEGDAGAAWIRDAVKASGGHATLVRAPTEVRAATDVFQPLDAAIHRLSVGIKAALDPAGILNPGRMYAGV
ncbi:glycolate oxidase subunit GlcE [Microvirga massiliensis]|uniref:glycolate oxidase subunit GlcE n=1 Tax=Microvirga massiliensis TaxID=1033741 RepID=UPI00062BCC49|nr:glycolate oxidase subunit GlcE [Microvirga massiliensis]